MEQKNINKNQLAKIISVGSSAVGKWVNGEITDLKLPSIVSLATFFGVTIDNLVFCNMKAQDKLKEMYTDFEYISVFKWNEKIDFRTAKYLKIPKILIKGNIDKTFVIEFSPEYYGVFPAKSILLFERDFLLTKNDVLLVRNKILNNLLFIIYNGNGYKSALTNELVDIDQYNVEGVLTNIILHEVFFNL